MIIRLSSSWLWLFLWLGVVSPAVADAGVAMPRSTAADGLYLNWNDCPNSPLAASDLTTACTNSGSEELVLAFELGQPTDSVIAIEAVLDVQLAPSQLPPWWQYAPDGCRYGRLVASASFEGRTSCVDFWLGAAGFDIPPAYYPGSPGGRQNQARILISFAVPSDQSRALAAATRYYAARLVFQNDATVVCSGCESPACLVLNSIRLIRVPGVVGGDVSVETPGAPSSNQVTWQGPGAPCGAVPTRRLSWGGLKSLFR